MGCLFLRPDTPAVFLFGSAVMYVLYVDESGNYAASADTFVVGGLAAHEEDLTELRARIRRVVAKHLDERLRGLEIHAQHMTAGKGAWRGVPKPVREQLLTDLCRMLATFQTRNKHPLRLFCVAASPGAVPHTDILERSFEELFLRFNEFLIRLAPGGGALGMVVADKAKYESTLQPIVTRWREQGTRFKKLERIVEVPLFCDSEASSLVQAADLVAHVVYRSYTRGDAALFDRLVGGFDEAGGVMHGLVHLTDSHKSCPCIACATRRAARKRDRRDQFS